jgi:hypothetical protein
MAEVGPRRLTYILLIAIVKINAFVVYKVLSLLILCIWHSVVRVFRVTASGLSVARVHQFNLDFLNVAPHIIRFLLIFVQTLVLAFVVQATTLLEVVIMLAFGLIGCSFLVLDLIPLMMLLPLYRLFF